MSQPQHDGACAKEHDANTADMSPKVKFATIRCAARWNGYARGSAPEVHEVFNGIGPDSEMSANDFVTLAAAVLGVEPQAPATAST